MRPPNLPGCLLVLMTSLSFAGAVAPALEDDANALFADGTLTSWRIEIPPAGIDSLRRQPREYVRATVRLGTQEWREVGLHLKGATGSFRPVDDKPSLTLDFARFVPAQRSFGLSKIHLNNSVEDPSYLHERTGAEIFRIAGVPAPRVGHARVELNGRALGLYVLKEGFAAEFLARHFNRADGNLYEPGEGHDVDEFLRHQSGSGVTNRSDLRRLAEAAAEPDPERRWKRLETVLDRQRFISFLAAEILAGHRDGYSLARNNFRLYHDPATDRFVFLPGGMDVLFGNPDATIRPHAAGLVAQAVLGVPAGRDACLQRMAVLLTNAILMPPLTNRVQAWADGVSRQLPPREAAALRREAALLETRITQRAASIARQLNGPEVEPLTFVNGATRPSLWRPIDAPADGQLDMVAAPEGKLSWHIRAGKVTSASWRSRVLVNAGRYRFEASARTAGVKPLAFGRNHGAALSVLGAAASSSARLTGDSPWTQLHLEFEIPKETEIELVCGLRASAGDAWFDTNSLQVLRLENWTDRKW